ncbi:MAG: leucyl/phenylalanyl-tRNA--protein transferase [Gammaproteobacteria bacterium]|nr:leucyl/phenylalanyl-tRNA--protein transferase [Gammaproteobacteria bacterium]
MMIELDTQNPCFPAVSAADSDGLLAIGGNLEITTLCAAYRRGIFPWYEDGQPLLWWSPDPRMVLLSNGMRVSRSLNKVIKSKFADIRLNHNFKAVIEQCAIPKNRRTTTWITETMRDAYLKLHQAGYAHSMEVYEQETLVGGLYGIGIGQMFFGESMFSNESDASKVALFYLCRHLYGHQLMLIDCQVQSPHLQTLGAFNIARTQFIEYVAKFCKLETPAGLWRPQRFPSLCVPQR